MNKSRLVSGFRSIVSIVAIFAAFIFVFVLADSANAASTIGTNMSTTGTFTVTPATDSATSIQFQNSAGTNYFIGNSTLGRVGIGAAPQTTFEVQGTASASYLLTGNTIQVGGFASVAYNRFGTAATTQGHYIASSNDVLINGDLEVDGSGSFSGPASFSNSLWVGTLGKTGNVGVGTNLPTTKFHVVGNASVSNNFETLKTASAKSLFATTNVVVGSGGTASSSAIYSLELGTNTTATTSILFGGSAASTKGTCFQFKDTGGTWVYARVRAGATSFTISNQQCHTGT